MERHELIACRYFYTTLSTTINYSEDYVTKYGAGFTHCGIKYYFIYVSYQILLYDCYSINKLNVYEK